MIVRAGPWIREGELPQEWDGSIRGITSINGRKPVALERRSPGLVRVLFERPGEDREPIPTSIGAMPEYVWDGRL